MIRSATDVSKHHTLHFPDWTGDTVVIVASGPSARDVPLHLAKDKARFIAVNNSWRLAPWAELLFATDWRWWRAYKGVPEFQGVKLTSEHRPRLRHWNVFALQCPKVGNDDLCDRWPQIGWSGNSGFGAANIAHHLGASKIILVGYDMRANGHWHGEHVLPGLTNPQDDGVRRWRRCMDEAAPRFRAKVIDCAIDGALTSYPKMTFEEALKC